jgi:hypothetical protein
VTLALLAGHSAEPTALAVVFIVLAVGLRFLRFRTRGGRRRGGPWGGGQTGGGGTGGDQPVQWDIRKTPEPEPTPDAVSEEQNPPSDL